MINIRKEQIKKLFKFGFATLEIGIWFSGILRQGLFKQWQYYGNKFYLIAQYSYNNNNHLDGELKLWHEYPKFVLKLHCFFNDNKYNGLYRKYNVNGDLMYELQFKDNKLIKIKYVDGRCLIFEKKEQLYYYDYVNNKKVYLYKKLKKWFENEYKKKTN